MERICEPELMVDPIQARAYAEADFGRSDRDFTERIVGLLRQLPPLRSPAEPLRVVDLGCGPGNISFRLADALPEAWLLGIDGAAAMLQPVEARRQLEPERWPRLRFQQALLPLSPGALAALPAGCGPPFQLLVSNSLLHHLHDPAVLWSAVRQLAAPGALVVVRDLRRPLSAAALRQLVVRHAAAAPAVLRRDFAHSLRAAFTLPELRRQLAAAGLADLQLRSLDDRYLEVWGRLP